MNADTTARLAAIWRLLDSAAADDHARRRYAAILAKGERILRDEGNAELADVLAAACWEVVAA